MVVATAYRRARSGRSTSARTMAAACKCTRVTTGRDDQQPAGAKVRPTDSIHSASTRSYAVVPGAIGAAARTRAGRRAPLWRAPVRRRGRLWRVLSAARRARGVRLAARSGRDYAGSRRDVARGLARGHGGGRRDRRFVRGRPSMSVGFRDRRSRVGDGRPRTEEPGRHDSQSASTTESRFSNSPSGPGRPRLTSSPVGSPGSAGLAFAAHETGHQRPGRRAQRRRRTISVSPLLLISDLGRPERFLNMLRVFKLTSPMSVGSWLLAANDTTTALATLGKVTGRLPRPSRAARAIGAPLGMPLTTYTAALIANTAVPLWHEGRRELPFDFAPAGRGRRALGALITPDEAAGPARRLAILVGRPRGSLRRSWKSGSGARRPAAPG